MLNNIQNPKDKDGEEDKNYNRIYRRTGGDADGDGDNIVGWVGMGTKYFTVSSSIVYSADREYPPMIICFRLQSY